MQPESEVSKTAQALARAECELIGRIKKGATEAECLTALQFYGDALLNHHRAIEAIRK